jgi:hypothetical protein
VAIIATNTASTAAPSGFKADMIAAPLTGVFQAMTSVRCRPWRILNGAEIAGSN